MIKTFIIIVLLFLLLGLVYLISTGAFCHLEIIKPNSTHLNLTTYLGAL